MCLVSFGPYFRTRTEYSIQIEFYFGKLGFGGLRISDNFEALAVPHQRNMHAKIGIKFNVRNLLLEFFDSGAIEHRFVLPCAACHYGKIIVSLVLALGRNPGRSFFVLGEPEIIIIMMLGEFKILLIIVRNLKIYEQISQSSVTQNDEHNFCAPIIQIATIIFSMKDCRVER